MYRDLIDEFCPPCLLIDMQKYCPLSFGMTLVKIQFCPIPISVMLGPVFLYQVQFFTKGRPSLSHFRVTLSPSRTSPMGNTDTEVFFGESSSEMNTLDRQKQIAMIMKMMMVVVLTTMFTIVRIVYNKKKNLCLEYIQY